jgi:hypothetical protein
MAEYITVITLVMVFIEGLFVAIDFAESLN